MPASLKILTASFASGEVYFSNITNENKLYRLLSSINLEKYINNFLINDYTSPELLFIQMLTRQPLNEEIQAKTPKKRKNHLFNNYT